MATSNTTAIHAPDSTRFGAAKRRRGEMTALRGADAALRALDAAASAAPCDRTRAYVLARAIASIACMAGTTAEAAQLLRAATHAQMDAAYPAETERRRAAERERLREAAAAEVAVPRAVEGEGAPA